MQEIQAFNYDVKTNVFGRGYQQEADFHDYLDFKFKIEDHGDERITATSKFYLS